MLMNNTNRNLPPTKYYKEGGYEIKSSPFAPAAADQVIRQVLKMLYQLYIHLKSDEINRNFYPHFK